jgi:hypothetical protein
MSSLRERPRTMTPMPAMMKRTPSPSGTPTPVVGVAVLMPSTAPVPPLGPVEGVDVAWTLPVGEALAVGESDGLAVGDPDGLADGDAVGQESALQGVGESDALVLATVVLVELPTDAEATVVVPMAPTTRVAPTSMENSPNTGRRDALCLNPPISSRMRVPLSKYQTKLMRQ